MSLSSLLHTDLTLSSVVGAVGALELFTALLHPEFSRVLGVILVYTFIFFSPVFVFYRYRYLASRTSWRGLIFKLSGSPWKFFWIYLSLDSRLVPAIL